MPAQRLSHSESPLLSLPQLSRRASLLAPALALGLSACGFRLRGSQRFAFKTLFVDFSVGSALLGEFKTQVQQNGQLQLVTDPRRILETDLVLKVFAETRLKTVVAASSAGQVREFQLVLRARMLLSNHKGRDLIGETELQQSQQLSYNESSALAKESDEAQLYKQMTVDLVQQMLTRLSSIKTLP
jgi:LPS-assembly lipoprotein